MGVTLHGRKLIWGIPERVPYTPGFFVSFHPKGFAIAEGLGGYWHIEAPEKFVTVLHKAGDEVGHGREFSGPGQFHYPATIEATNDHATIVQGQ